MPRRWLLAWGLGSVAFGGASLLVPLYLVQLGATPVHLGVLAATAASVGAPGAIVFGRLADRVAHRRSLVLLTLGGVAGTLAAIPALTTVASVIVANAVLWLVVASVAPVLTMLVVDDAPPSAWAERIGQLNAYQGYGWAGGLVLGAVWPVVGGRVGGTRVLFWALAACAAASALWAVRTLPRPAPGAHVSGERGTRRVARLLATTGRGVRGATFAFAPNRLYWSTRGLHPRRLRERLSPGLAAYLFAATLFFTGFAAFWAPLPLVFADTGFGDGQIFALYLVSSLASAGLYDRAGRLAGSHDLRVVQSAALAVRGASFPGVAVVAGLGALAVELAGAGLGLAIVGATWAVVAVVGTTIVTRLAPPAIQGEVLGLHAALGALAGGLGGLLGGWTATFGYLPAFGIAGGLVLAGAAIVGLLGTSVGDALAGRVAGSSRTEPSADTRDPDEPTDARSR